MRKPMEKKMDKSKRDIVPWIGGFVSALLLATLISLVNFWRDSITESEILSGAVADIVAIKEEVRQLRRDDIGRTEVDTRFNRIEEKLTTLRIAVEAR